MRWKMGIEIVGMATALAALFGVFGILINVFFKGEYFTPLAGVSIVEPHILILIVEVFLIVVSIPIMIYVGLKDIKSLVKIDSPAEIEKKEKKASNIFIRSIVIGLTLALIVGLIIYVDDMNYKNEKLKYNIRKMDRDLSEMNGTIDYLEIELLKKNEIVKKLTIDNRMLQEDLALRKNSVLKEAEST